LVLKPIEGPNRGEKISDAAVKIISTIFQRIPEIPEEGCSAL